MPGFNMRGRTLVYTLSGGILSFMVALVILSYGAIKLVQLLQRENPNVSEVLSLNVFDNTEVVSLTDIGFKIAFSIEGYLDQQMKDDPRYIKYLVRSYGKRDSVPFEKIHSIHKCTDADYAEFPPPQTNSVDLLN